MKNHNINHEIAIDMINRMPDEKKNVLRKALDRNLILTSSRNLENGTMTVYKEGFYLTLEGTRCSFSVFAYDRDGEFEFTRKPREDKLNKIYKETYIKFSESDYSGI